LLAQLSLVHLRRFEHPFISRFHDDLTSTRQTHINHSSSQLNVCLMCAWWMFDELCHCSLYTWTGLAPVEITF